MDFSDAALSMPTFHVLTVPAFKDNYLWVIHDGSHAAVVDPGDGEAIGRALEAHQLTLTAILLTHHHADHIGGVDTLRARFDVPVYGPANDGIAAVTVALSEGDHVDVPGLDGLRFDVLDVPGHTRGHIAYFRPGEHPWLFCGDTLFAGGCGRLFEGTAEQMVASLAKLASLPDDTLVFCAHEYTLSNLKFAREVDPANTALAARVTTETRKRAQDTPTVPSTIALEKATNPFLRHTDPGVVASLESAGKLPPGATPVQAFAALREWKNVY
jgi:hydroxyacylglutathione hydrolase